jgi:hypothetical protein
MEHVGGHLSAVANEYWVWLGMSRQLVPRGRIMRQIALLLCLLLILAAGFGGFVYLDTWKAVLWLIFIVVACPVLYGFLVSTADGTKFEASDLISLYTKSLRSLPLLGKLIPSKER